MESHHQTIDGIRMRWEERAGSDPPVVLLHGIPTSPALWRHLGPVPEGPRLLAWEMVGYGHSIAEGRGRDISVARQAGYLSSWMRAIGVDRAVLVGHDLGGGVAQIVAVREPARCAGLVMINSISYDSWPIPSVRALRAAGAVVERLPAAALWPVFGTLLLRGHDDLSRTRESMRIHIRPYLRPDGAAALIRQVRSLDTEDTLRVQAALPDIDRPASVVWGAADRFQKLRYGTRLAADLGATMVVIPRGKHFVPEDHPDAVAHAVGRVLEAAG